MAEWLGINKEAIENEKIAKETMIKYNSLMRGDFKTDEERQHISQNYTKYCMQQPVRGSIKKIKQKTFHDKINKGSDIPSEFMMNFIEATHNLFQIQQKKIDELEMKLNASNA